MIKIFSWLRRRKSRAVLIAIIWTALICTACFIPGYEVPNVQIPFADKWVHFVIFAGFSIFWLAVYRNVSLQKYLLIFLISVLAGYAVELVQGSGITVGRAYEIDDVKADALGGALGCAIFWLMDFWSKNKKPLIN